MEFSIIIIILWTAALFATAFILVALEFWAKDWAKKRGFPRRRFPSGGNTSEAADCIVTEEVSLEQGRDPGKKLEEFKLIFSSGLDLWRGVVRLCKNLENLRK